MKTFVATALAVLVTAGAALASDPVLGTWNTERDENGYLTVSMQQCGATICGVIQNGVNGSGQQDSTNVGKRLVLDLQAQGGGDYTGQLWHPGKDKIFKGKAHLSGNHLTMKGCVLGGLICQGQTWTRVK